MERRSSNPVQPTDQYNRGLSDLRISLTDRCNFRCTYCMPRELFGAEHLFLPKSELLDFDEIERLTRLFAGLGVHKLRLTGGEPLLRRGLPELVDRLARIDGIDDLCLTTNGSLLTHERAEALAASGLSRVTLSLDAIDDAVFRSINDVDYPVADVLGAIDNAQSAGLGPIKVNCVLQRGVNENQILPMIEQFRGTGVVPRFIEYMDVGASNGWRLDDVVPAREIVDTVRTEHDITALAPAAPGATASRWHLTDDSLQFGVIASITQPFCGGCSRARLSAIGELYTCLFGVHGRDLRALLRDGADDATIESTLASIWRTRTDRFSERRTAATQHETAGRRVEMSYIGG